MDNKKDSSIVQYLPFFQRERAFNWIVSLVLVVLILTIVHPVSIFLFNGEKFFLIGPVLTTYGVMAISLGTVRFLDRIPFTVRSGWGLVCFYSLALVSFGLNGASGSTLFYFFCFSGSMAFLFGRTAGGIAVALILASLAAAGGIHFQWGGVPGLESVSVIQYTVDVIVVIVPCILVAFFLPVLIQSMAAGRRSEQGLSLVDEQGKEVFWLLDPDLKILQAYGPVHAVTGRYPEVLIKTAFVDLLSPENAGIFKSLVKDSAPFCFQQEMTNAAGHSTAVEISGIKASAGNQSCRLSYRGVIRDISRIKYLEMQHMGLTKELAKSERLKSLGILTGSVAHDLNNIMSGIATYPGILLMTGEYPDPVGQGLKMIEDTSRKTANVIGDLSTISKGIRAQMDVININDVMESYLSSEDWYTIRQAHPRLRLELDLEPLLLNMKGSYIHIEKIIINLILNRIEAAAPQKKLHIVFSTANIRVNTVLSDTGNLKPGTYVALRIWDTEHGIRAGDFEWILDPALVRQEMEKDLTGLGLILVWNAVQDHKGVIRDCSGRRGNGVEFLFPAAGSEPFPIKEDGYP